VADTPASAQYFSMMSFVDRRVTKIELLALADRFLAPLISSNVNEYAHQPCLFIPQSAWNGFE